MRKLAAILFADIVGYSRFMDQDEQGTVRRVADLTLIVNGLVAEHSGELIKTSGDGFMIAFPSALDAVTCALALLQALHLGEQGEDPSRRLRIGIHFGDVIARGRDLFGEVVNVAARLESIADPDCVCISRAVYDQIRKRVPARVEDRGPIALKNISEPVHVVTLIPVFDAAGDITLDLTGSKKAARPKRSYLLAIIIGAALGIEASWVTALRYVQLYGIVNSPNPESPLFSPLLRRSIAVGIDRKKLSKNSYVLGPRGRFLESIHVGFDPALTELGYNPA